MIKLLSSETIAASGDATSAAVLVGTDPGGFPRRNAEGYFSIAAVVTGSGTAKIEYLVPTTTDGSGLIGGYGGFIEPAAASDVATGLTVGSYAASFAPIPCDAIKLKVTETGTSDSVTIDLYLVVK